MIKVLTFVVLLIASTFGIPLEKSDDNVLKDMNLQEMANIFMSQPIKGDSGHTANASIELKVTPVHSSHLIGSSKDSAIGAIFMPFKAGKESAAVGGQITAAAALKGTVGGSAIATPIILKAVALPGIAAGATSAVMSLPNWIAQNMKDNSHLLFQNVKTSVEDSTHGFANLFIIDDSVHLEEDLNLDLKKGAEKVAKTVGALKVGALGLATKGLVKAKNGIRLILKPIVKPIAILTGLHLKMLGSGIALGGKLLKGTGAGIAKTGTIVKITGLGSIGLGASAIGWGLDKSTIDTHFKESNLKFSKEKEIKI